ncbi:hypothetical protein, partial [Brevundimonas sp.]|uniref:hypothetical protein n=1 Tax=Brevundimonas sp. TaxID=1871086 RepID=UPI00391CD209
TESATADDDIPQVLQAPTAEPEPLSAVVVAVDAETLPPVEPDEGKSPDAADKGGIVETEAVEVVVPPVQPEPRGRGGKRKR